jgi:hypothetical protein
VAPKRSTFDWVREAIGFAGLVMIVAVVLAHWANLPTQVPRHFTASGQPNRWGDKSGLFVLPAVAAGVYILLTVVPRYPQLLNLPFEVDRNSPAVQSLVLTMTTMLKAEVILMFLYIEWASVRTALGSTEGLGGLFLPLALATMFITAGAFLVKLHRCRK